MNTNFAFPLPLVIYRRVAPTRRPGAAAPVTERSPSSSPPLTTALSAPAIINLLYLAMIYLSDFLIPLPKSIEWIALASPAYYLDQRALSAMGAPSHGAALTHIGLLAAVTLLPAAMAIRRLARVG